ncbi:MAG: FAD-dependent oxidoreductase, partial [Leeuwenhoekiella sp.]
MKRIIVVGNGMVGYKFCEKLVAKENRGDYTITVFGEEPRPAYDRVHLSEYFADKSADELLMAPRTWYEEHDIELRTSELISHINLNEKQVITYKHQVFEYDYLVLATGSFPFVPPIKGSDKAGVFVYRTIEDLDAMKTYASKIKLQGKTRAAVLGGGLLGLEAANAAKELGLEAHVVEFAPRLMPRQLDQAASDMLQHKIESLGIGIHLGKATKEIVGEEHIELMDFADETELKVDMLIISAGIRPRDELALNAGLKVGDRGGIWVNNTMRTSDESVFAIGEAALYNNMIYGLVAPGYDMADVAVEQITGGDKVMVPSRD